LIRDVTLAAVKIGKKGAFGAPSSFAGGEGGKKYSSSQIRGSPKLFYSLALRELTALV
jgi:hypothetical protein